MKGPEGKFQDAVLALCKLRHLRVAHFRASRTKRGNWITAVAADGAGWPDLTVVGPGGMVFRELKSPTGVVEPEQQEWLDWLSRAGADAAVWRPADLDSGEIDETLRRLSRPAVA